AAMDDLVALVELGAAARRDDDEVPLLPARYHFWLRALEGGYACLHPSHPASAARLRLARFDFCPACSAQGRTARMVELGTCRRCAAPYALGARDGECLAQPKMGARLTYVLLDTPTAASDEDEADGEPASTDSLGRAAFLCPACCFLAESVDDGCECAED